MLDLGEISLLEENLLSTDICAKISEINIDMAQELKDGDEKSDLFKKSYPQGVAFARIAGLFSQLDESFKKNISEAAGYYDYGTHIFQEILDYYLKEKNYLTDSQKSVETAFAECIEAYKKSEELCPQCGMLECITDEKALIEELAIKPEELQKVVARKRMSKKEKPQTVLMQVNKK
jgi:hypothetical protein